MSSENSNISQCPDPKPQNVGVEVGLGTRLVAEIQGLAVGGRGVARVAGRVWFVIGGLPGDRVEIEVLELRGRHGAARVHRMLRPGPSRRSPPCPLADRCGGCPWMGLLRAEQVQRKRTLIRDTLQRIAGMPDVRLAATRTVSEELGYRNRVEFTVGLDAAGRPMVGLHRAVPGQGGVDVDRCALQSDEANAVLGTARRYLLDPKRRLGEKLRGRRGALRLMIRHSRESGQTLVALRETREPFPLARGLAAELARAHPRLAGVARLKGAPGRRGGVRVLPLVGRTWIDERIGGIRYRLPAGTFSQVSAAAAGELVRLVAETVGPLEGGRVLDLYGGIGAYGSALLKRGAGSVVVCDADRNALASGRRAARRRGETRISFVRADVGKFLTRDRAEDGTESVVANPPRTGLGRGVAPALAGTGARRIVLVSCDPATLARDLHAIGRHGYSLERVVPVDLFPQTAHVEVVARLDRR